MAEVREAWLNFVDFLPESSGLVGDHAAGATVLNVASGRVFGDLSTARVGGNDYPYRRDGETLVIEAPGLLVAADDGDPVERINGAGEPEGRRVARIDFDGDGESDDEAEIPTGARGYFVEGPQPPGTVVDVESTEFGYRLISRPYETDVLTGTKVQTAESGARAVLQHAATGGGLYVYTNSVKESYPGFMSASQTDLGSGDVVLQAAIQGPQLSGGGAPAAPTLALSTMDVTGIKQSFLAVAAQRVQLNSDFLVLTGTITSESLADGGSNNTNSGAKYCRVGAAGNLFSSIVAPSSRTIKHDIEDLAVDPDALLSLRPVTFRYDEDPDHLRVGFIAEEAHDAGLGVFVGYEDRDDPERPTGFDYDGITAGLVALAQRQQEQIDALTARLDALTE